MRMTVILLLGILTAVSGFRRTSMSFNKETGGYEDVTIVVSPELSAGSCPQILHNIKVWLNYHVLNIYYLKPIIVVSLEIY